MILERSKNYFGDDVWTITECPQHSLKYLPYKSKKITTILFLKGIKPKRLSGYKILEYEIPEDIQPIILDIFNDNYIQNMKSIT